MSLRTLIKQTLGLKASAKPKAKNTYPTTPSTGTYYEGMNQDYRWFRQDELTRKCITTNAYFATANGFETILEAETPEQYAVIKEKIDEVNRRVNLDKVLYDAQIKRSIHGRAAYEVVRDGRGLPERLLLLQSPKIKPDLDEAEKNVRVAEVFGDGAYDSCEVYEELERRRIEAVIKPRVNARSGVGPQARRLAVGQIRELGYGTWAELVGYGGRWAVETAYSTFKRVFGENAMGRSLGASWWSWRVRWLSIICWLTCEGFVWSGGWGSDR